MTHHDPHIPSCITPPKRLLTLKSWLLQSGHSEVSTLQRATRHPLLLPLTVDDRTQLVGLLCWPTAPKNMPLAVVRQTKNGLRLLANSVDELLHTELASRDAMGELPADDPLLRETNQRTTLYERGAVHHETGSIAVYLLKHVGVTHHFFRQLANAHLKKSDHASASVTADRATRCSTGWGAPHAYRAQLLAQLGQVEEARDAARFALLQPLWTLEVPWEPVAELAGWPHPLKKMAFRGLAQNTDKAPLDRAAHWMDAGIAEGLDWALVRREVNALYEAAGLKEFAEFLCT